jgi:DNA-binding CsgD family transcriptional regulator
MDEEDQYATFGSSDLLSPREKEIVGMIRRGLSNNEMADYLSISYHTVKTHIQRIYKKYGVNNKATFLYSLSKPD